MPGSIHNIGKNAIVMWSGLFIDIPKGWVLCDGENGTPDLRNKFVQAEDTQPKMNSTGGDATHEHPFITDSHGHSMAEGTDIGVGTDKQNVLGGDTASGTTDSEPTQPTYYSLFYIMEFI